PSTRTLTLSTSGVIDTGDASITIAGPINGTSGLTKAGIGTLTLTNSGNSYSGGTSVTAGILAIGASDVIPDGTGKGDVSVSNGAKLTIAGDFNETINGLTGAGVVDKTAGAGTSTFTVGATDASSTFSGSIQNS